MHFFPDLNISMNKASLISQTRWIWSGRNSPLILFAAIFFWTSCAIPKSSVLYFQDTSQSREGFIARASPAPYKIKANDLLYIQVVTPDFENKQFLETPNAKTGAESSANPYLSSYSVSDSGEVALPYIGKTKVGGKTLAEAAQSIEVQVKRYVRNAEVSVKLGSFAVSVLGEVRTPGRFPVLTGQITVFEALAKRQPKGRQGNPASGKRVFFFQSGPHPAQFARF
jgi:polysaccharide biosynthesis/export protein